MAKYLVIVESPSKARTIEKYLGSDFKVEASSGHLVDLPSRDLGVDIENDFKPNYTVIEGKQKYLNALKKAARGAEKVYLAPDPDREGEAIAWHIAEKLALGEKAQRVLIREITKAGVRESMNNPLEINKDRFESQQARRILDRIVGYQVSPVLWKKVKRGLSAGRVQSVALRFVVDREREIQSFKPREYWSIEANLKKTESSETEAFTATLNAFRGKKAKIENQEQSKEVLDSLAGKDFVVKSVGKKEQKRKPVAPFITSTLQQEASKKIRFSVKRTMSIAQKLYEGIELGSKGPVGLITYMRTDSFRASENAIIEAREFIASNYSPDYIPKEPNVFKVKKQAQDAHECIRPTFPSRHPDELRKFLTDEQYKLYLLIWQRFIASQMTPAVYDRTQVDIEADVSIFRATGNVMKFAGFTAVYQEIEEKEELGKQTKDSEKNESKKLPPLSEKEILDLLKLEPKQHFTKPPPRYSESLLVKELEEKGIGRPSTYASILSTIQDRGYVEREKRNFFPTSLGFSVNDFLVEGFPNIMDQKFTAQMETDLDRVEEGTINWVDLLRGFYNDFSESVTHAEHDIERKEIGIPTDVDCEECGKLMVIKEGKFGQFLACTGYPDCKNTADFIRSEGGEIVISESLDSAQCNVECDKCGAPMEIKRGRFGQFLACTGYPDCKNTADFIRSKDGEIVINKSLDSAQCDIECDKCGASMEIKRGKYGEFLSCSQYPKCKNPKEFARAEDGTIVIKKKETPQLREDVLCEKCGKSMVVRKSRRGPFLGCSGYPKCRNTLNLDQDGNVVKKATKKTEKTA